MIVCSQMQDGEILNPDKTGTPILHALLYGDRVETKKFSKRLSCAIKHLPLRMQFNYEYDTQKAIEAGVIKDPSLVLDGKIFLEGLPQAEQITEAFETYLESGKNV